MEMPLSRNERTVGLFLSVLKAAWAGAVVRCGGGDGTQRSENYR